MAMVFSPPTGMRKWSGATGIQQVWVSKEGSDSNDGKSPGSAWLTVTHAIAAAPSGSQIFIGGGVFAGTLTFGTDWDGALIGQGGAGRANATYITPPASSPNANAIEIFNEVGGLAFYNIWTQNPSPNGNAWYGHGWHLGPVVEGDGASSANYFENCGHSGHAALPLEDTDGGSGGTGLYIQGNIPGGNLTACEGNYFNKFVATQANTGVFLGDESAATVFMHMNSSGCRYRALLIGPGSGGGLFVRHKSVQNRYAPFTGQTMVEIGGGGGNVFIESDWSEENGAVSALISSDNNIFHKPVSAPACAWHITGDNNAFYSPEILGATWTIDGNHNRIMDPAMTGSIVDNGSGNIIDNVAPGQAGTITTNNKLAPGQPFRALRDQVSGTTVGLAGGAAAAPATGAKWMLVTDPTTGERLMVEGHLPPASPVLDTFDRANTTFPHALGTTDSGHAWTVQDTGGSASTWAITSNLARMNSGNTGLVTVTTAADGLVAVDMPVLPGGNHAGLLFRLTDENNYWRLRVTSDGSVALVKIVATVETQLAAYGAAIAAGGHIAVALNGSAISVVAGGPRETFTDSFNSTATKHGLAASVDGTARFNNFRVTA